MKKSMLMMCGIPVQHRCLSVVAQGCLVRPVESTVSLTRIWRGETGQKWCILATVTACRGCRTASPSSVVACQTSPITLTTSGTPSASCSWPSRTDSRASSADCRCPDSSMQQHCSPMGMSLSCVAAGTTGPSTAVVRSSIQTSAACFRRGLTTQRK